jgi:hypothetical protein
LPVSRSNRKVKKKKTQTQNLLAFKPFSANTEANRQLT